MQLELCGSSGMQNGNITLTALVKTTTENLCDLFRPFHHTVADAQDKCQLMNWAGFKQISITLFTAVMSCHNTIQS